ncbi:hypothetical protein Tco_0880712 [Tanacetum coccineum]
MVVVEDDGDQDILGKIKVGDTFEVDLGNSKEMAVDHAKDMYGECNATNQIVSPRKEGPTEELINNGYENNQKVVNKKVLQKEMRVGREFGIMMLVAKLYKGKSCEDNKMTEVLLHEGSTSRRDKRRRVSLVAEIERTFHQALEIECVMQSGATKRNYGRTGRSDKKSQQKVGSELATMDESIVYFDDGNERCRAANTCALVRFTLLILSRLRRWLENLIGISVDGAEGSPNYNAVGRSSVQQ